MAPKPPNDGSTRTPGTGNFQGVSPVLLSSQCNVSANNSGVPDSEELSYPFRKAVVIDEIRWTLRTDAPVNSSQQLGAAVFVKMQIGRHFLMRDPVPLWLLGTMMAVSQETDRDLETGQDYSTYRWRLPKPLYVEAGGVLRSTFSRGDDGFDPIHVRVSYAGKTVAPDQPVPSIISVPYVAPFVTPVGVVYSQSNENHLFNPYDFPLMVQRLTGRVLNFVSRSKLYMQEKPTPTVAGSDITVLMNDSWGGKMINNNTGPSDAFDILRTAWTVDTIMPPKGVYEVRVWNIPAATSLHVAMIAYRDEAL